MSEYQYYEFQTIDRRLAEEEQAAIRELSSRVQLSSTQAVFTYQFGDFRGDPVKVLTRYFDALLYLASWGTRRLMFRFPQSRIPRRRVERYCTEDWMTFEEGGNFSCSIFGGTRKAAQGGSKERANCPPCYPCARIFCAGTIARSTWDG
jgi:hypothetical protein